MRVNLSHWIWFHTWKENRNLFPFPLPTSDVDCVTYLSMSFLLWFPVGLSHYVLFPGKRVRFLSVQAWTFHTLLNMETRFWWGEQIARLWNFILNLRCSSDEVNASSSLFFTRASGLGLIRFFSPFAWLSFVVFLKKAENPITRQVPKRKGSKCSKRLSLIWEGGKSSRFARRVSIRMLIRLLISFFVGAYRNGNRNEMEAKALWTMSCWESLRVSKKSENLNFPIGLLQNCLNELRFCSP